MMSFKGGLCAVVVAVGLFCATPLLAQGNITGDPGPMILTPSEAAVILGDQITFDVAVNLSGITGTNCNSFNANAVLGGYTVRLNYDSTKLSFASASAGTSSPYSGVIPVAGPADPDGVGYVNLAAANGGSQSSPIGLVHFATVTFDTVGLGSSNVDLTAVSLSSALQCSGGLTGQSGGPDSISAAPDSESISVLAVPPPPGPFMLVAPANLSRGLTPPITFQWTASANANSYVFGLAIDGNQVQPYATTSNLSYTIIDLMPGTTYIWRVKAKTSSGGSLESTTWRFTTSGSACPDLGAPTVTLPAEAPSGDEFVLSWTDVEGATGYRIEESLYPDFSVVTLSTVSGDVTELTISKSVLEDTPFYYRIAAINDEEPCDVIGEYSSALTITVMANPIRRGTIPIIGKTAGDFGASFITAMQMHNPWSMPLTGHLEFYAQDVEASEADEVYEYSVPAGETISMPDVMGLLARTGIGSLDVVGDPNQPLPVTTARVANLIAEGGTTGTAESLVEEGDRLLIHDTAVLIAPLDLTATRFNVGLRTFENSTTLTFTVKNAAGSVMKTMTRSYAPDYFNQWSSSEFFGMDLSNDDSIYVEVVSGSAIFYGTTTDNTTNDPAISVAQKVDMDM